MSFFLKKSKSVSKVQKAVFFYHTFILNTQKLTEEIINPTTLIVFFFIIKLGI